MVARKSNGWLIAAVAQKKHKPVWLEVGISPTCPCHILKTYSWNGIMDDKKTGGAAFPDPGRAQSAKQREIITETGMTLRDWFAGKALTIVAAAGGIDHIGPYECASAAYEIADAMLAERAKP
jgi:hypothetical protein